MDEGKSGARHLSEASRPCDLGGGLDVTEMLRVAKPALTGSDPLGMRELIGFLAYLPKSGQGLPLSKLHVIRNYEPDRY